MELRQLRYFVSVAETLSFSEAARNLFITQSTLSQQIRQLETELSTPLFVRSSHAVALTEAGSELLSYARATLHAADTCLARIADLNDLAAGTLNIGVTYSFSPILTETLISFTRLYPAIKLNIFYKPMSELMTMLKQREVDFALAFKPTVAIAGIESHIIFQNKLSAIVRPSHALASSQRVTLDQLAAYPLALPSKGLQARNAFDAIASGVAGKMKVKIELNEVNILLDIIRRTDIVTILAEATIHGESGVKAIPIDAPDNEMAGCLHLLEDSYRKRSMQEFLRLLNESVAVRERQCSWFM